MRPDVPIEGSACDDPAILSSSLHASGDETAAAAAAETPAGPGHTLSPRKKKDNPSVSWKSNVHLNSSPKDSRVSASIATGSGEATGARPCTPLRSRPASAGRARPDSAQQRRLPTSSAASPTAPRGNNGVDRAAVASSSSSPTLTPRFMASTKASTAITTSERPRSPSSSNSPTMLFVRSASFNSKATEQDERKLKKEVHNILLNNNGGINKGEATGARPCTPLRSRPASAGRARPDSAQQRRLPTSSAASPTAPRGNNGVDRAAVASSSSSPTLTPRFMASTKASTAVPYVGSTGAITRSSSDLSPSNNAGSKSRSSEKNVSDPSSPKESDRLRRNASSDVIERLLKCPEKHKDWCNAEQKKRQAAEAKVLTFAPDLSATSAHNRKLARPPSSPKKSEGGGATSPSSAGNVFDRLSRITTASLQAEYYTSPPPALPFSGDSILNDAAISNLPKVISDPLVTRKRQ